MKTIIKTKISEGQSKIRTFVFKNFKSTAWNEKRRFSSNERFIFS